MPVRRHNRSRSHLGRPGQGGFTLIEIIVVLAIIGLIMGSAVVGLRSLAKSGLRTTVGKFSGACRYLFDRASTTGRTHRMGIDLARGTYWAEVTDDRFFAPREPENEETKKKDAEAQEKEEAKRQTLIELAKTDRQAYERLEFQAKEFTRKRVQFHPFKDSTLHSVKMSSARVVDFYTPRLSEPIKEGVAYLYFYPMGQTEPAIIHFSDTGKGEDVYSVVVHPITGRVKVYDTWVDAPLGERFDDEGNRVVEESQ